jgi:hypothetical protein
VIGPITLALACTGIVSALSLSLAVRVTRPTRQLGGHWADFARVLIMISLSIAIYTVDIFKGVALINRPGDADVLFTLATLILAIYGIGLIRAWELLGAPRTGISGWMKMNPLRDLPEDGASEPAAAAAAAAPGPPIPPLPRTPGGAGPHRHPGQRRHVHPPAPESAALNERDPGGSRSSLAGGHCRRVVRHAAHICV